MVTLESVAVATAARFPVLPLMPGGKPPAVRRGVHSATRDLDQIRSWWQQLPNANLGIRTGAGVVGIDLDTKHGESGFVELCAYAHHSGIRDTEWLDTFTVTTPSRGLHLYYATEVEVPNRVGVLPGVDCRGEDGYLVGAYSRIGGRHYLPESRYTEEVEVDQVGIETLESFTPELAAIPEWLLELIAKPKPAATVRVFPEVEILATEGSEETRVRDLPSYLEAVLLGERDRLLSAEPGTRNDALNRSAYRLGRHVGAGRLDLDNAEAWLLGVAGHMRVDESGERADLTVAEIRATVRSGLSAGVRDA